MVSKSVVTLLIILSATFSHTCLGPDRTWGHSRHGDGYNPGSDSRRDRDSMVDTTKPNPAAGNLPGVYVFAGQNGVGSRIAPADKNSNNLGPRLGLAYALNDKTVLRSAYGISYFQTGAYGGGNNVNQNDAYWPTSTTSSPDDLTGAYSFAQGFPARDLVIPPLITPALGVGTGFVNYWHPTAGRAGRGTGVWAYRERLAGA